MREQNSALENLCQEGEMPEFGVERETGDRAECLFITG